MAFAEDLDAFFSTDDFAVDATLAGVAVKGIFDEPYLEPLDNRVEGAAPSFTLKEAAAPSVAQGQTLVIGARTFKVRGVEPDGTGVVWLRLEEQ